MTPRLPFTLTPLPGEPFGLWWHTYACALGVTRSDLAKTVGIPTGQAPNPAHAPAIAAAAGLPSAEVAALFTSTRPDPADHILRTWTPGPTSWWCPDCLAAQAAWDPAWRLPATFYCLTHDRPLAQACPACGEPASWRTALTAARTCQTCGYDLAAADRPAPDAAARTAQQRITALQATLHDPTATPDQRGQAHDQLSDLTLIAWHLTGSPIPGTGALPDAAAFTTAVALLDGHHTSDGTDPITALVGQRRAHRSMHAVPFSWRATSPALAARIAHARDHLLTPTARLRSATTLPAPAPRPAFRRPALRCAPDPADPAVRRAARLPDQLWPAWAIRLSDTDRLSGPVFRAAMLVALLLPGSDLSLPDITALLPHRPDPGQAGHQLRRLSATGDGTAALKILTELAFALDRADIPIDYPRRRQLAVSTTLIDAATWQTYCRQAGLRSGGPRRLHQARRYLYELLTGNSLATAPGPYHLPEGMPRTDYAEFTTTLPADLVTALTAHARNQLTAAGITGEPLTWQPPTDWVTVTTWPGADPDATDPAPIHQALRDRWRGATEHWALTRADADALGVSSEHLRHILRRHPIDRGPYPQHRSGAVIPTTPADHEPRYRADPDPHHPKRIYLVNLDWLREEYLGWDRSLTDIAAQIGCRKATLKLFAKTQNIPRRPRSGGPTCIAAGTIPGHPADLPDPLRLALRGQRARPRLERFLNVVTYPSLNQAAVALGVHNCTLTTQLHTLERACRGQLLQRNPQPQPVGPLTPLGELLCRQAREHLTLTPSS